MTDITQSAAPTLLQVAPHFAGLETPEPSLSNLIYRYYRHHFKQPLADDYASKYIAALSATPQAPAEPVAWQSRRKSSDPFDANDPWSRWREIEPCDMERIRRSVSLHPQMFEMRPVYATPPAQEVQASQAAPSDEQINNLLSELDQIARDEDSYDYGLPLHHEPAGLKMRLAVRDALATPQAPAAPVAYRAWFDEDNGARWLFTLWPEEERLDVEWQPLYATPPAPSVQASQAAPSDAALRRCLGFFASVIKSGEPWTESCEREYRAALTATHAAQPVAQAGKYDNVLRPFVALMERELHANAHKGDRPGWIVLYPNQLLLEIYWHTAKLSAAVKNDNRDGIREHAADVANMSMMLLDVCGGLEVQA